jgi:mono/diheme cytochrome c family protein
LPGGPPEAAGRRPGGALVLAAVAVPTPTADQLDRADAASADAVGRGAAIYFAQGCASCHAAAGDAPGNLGLRRGGSPDDVRTIRQGRPGMPAYSQAQISDSELRDMQAYLATIGGSRRAND